MEIGNKLSNIRDRLFKRNAPAETPHSPQTKAIMENGARNLLKGMYTNEKALTTTGARVVAYGEFKRTGEEARRSGLDPVSAKQLTSIEADADISAQKTTDTVAGMIAQTRANILSVVPESIRDEIDLAALQDARAELLKKLSGKGIDPNYKIAAEEMLRRINARLNQLAVPKDQGNPTG